MGPHRAVAYAKGITVHAGEFVPPSVPLAAKLPGSARLA